MPEKHSSQNFNIKSFGQRVPVFVFWVKPCSPRLCFPTMSFQDISIKVDAADFVLEVPFSVAVGQTKGFMFFEFCCPSKHYSRGNNRIVDSYMELLYLFLGEELSI